jgi:hypothetical protein
MSGPNASDPSGSACVELACFRRAQTVQTVHSVHSVQSVQLAQAGMRIIKTSISGEQSIFLMASISEGYAFLQSGMSSIAKRNADAAACIAQFVL